VGPRLDFRAILACLLIGILAFPIDADASRSKKKKKRAPAAASRVVAPPPSPVAPPADAPAITLSGTYGLTRIGARPVRDPDLLASRITFGPNFQVNGSTACNGFQGRLHTDRSKRKIVGFDQLVATEMGCPGPKGEAEATTLRLLNQTANIARAGSTITLFNSVGVTLAQFSAVNPTSNADPDPEAAPPRRRDNTAQRSITGDYVLSELGGRPVAVRPPSSVVPQPVALPNTRYLTILPTLYLREGGAATGMSGCNNYGGTLSIAEGQPPRFGPVISTTKSCLDRPTQRAEREIIAALQGAARVDVSQTRVNLLRADGTRLARFSTATQGRGTPLMGTNWVMRSFNGANIGPARPPTITFEGNQAIGFTGCNRFNMVHNRRGNRSRFQDGAMTKMACTDQGRNDLETRFMRGLASITTLNVSASQLTMRSDDGNTIMVFEAD
jgi:heat shock protein HslJ